MKTTTKKTKKRERKQPVATGATAPVDASVSNTFDAAEVVTGAPVSNAFDAGAVSADAGTVTKTDDTVADVPALVDAGTVMPVDDGVTVSKERLRDLEQTFLQRMKEANNTAASAIETILIIRDERQYKAEGFETFQEYMDSKWGYTRQWVHQQEKHLKMVRVMQARLGFSPDEAATKVTLFDTGILRPLDDDPDVLVEAIKDAEEAYAAADKKSPKLLKKIVANWQSYQSLRDRLQSEDDDSDLEGSPPLTPDEWRILSELSHLEWHLGSPYPKYRFSEVSVGKSKSGKSLIELAWNKGEAENLPFAEALKHVCREHRAIPIDVQLLQASRGCGENLKNLVAPLAAMATEWKTEDKAKQAAKRTAEAEPDDVKPPPMPTKVEAIKTPEQIQAEQEEQQRREAEREAEREKWDFVEDDLSLSTDYDPRKFAEWEAPFGEGYQSGTLARIAADCLADAVNRIPLSTPEELADAVKAAKKAKHWAEELLRGCGESNNQDEGNQTPEPE